MGNRRSEINVVMSEILEDNQLMDISLADIVNKSFSEINVSQQEKMLIEALNAAEQFVERKEVINLTSFL